MVHVGEDNSSACCFVPTEICFFVDWIAGMLGRAGSIVGVSTRFPVQEEVVRVLESRCVDFQNAAQVRLIKSAPYK